MEQVKSFCRRYRRLLLAAAYLAIFAVGVLYLRVTVNIPPEGDDKLTLNLWLYDFQRMPFWQYALQDLQGRLRYFTLQEVRFFPFHYPNAVDLLFYTSLTHYRLYIIAWTGAAAFAVSRVAARLGSGDALALGGFALALAAAPIWNEGMYSYYAVPQRALFWAMTAWLCLFAWQGTRHRRWAVLGAVLSFIACGTYEIGYVFALLALVVWLLRRRSVKNALLDTAPALGGMGAALVFHVLCGRNGGTGNELSLDIPAVLRVTVQQMAASLPGLNSRLLQEDAGVITNGDRLWPLALGVLMDKFNPFRVLALSYATGAICIVMIGLSQDGLWLMALAIFGTGIGISGSQVGLNALTATLYPTQSRATGVSWSNAIGRCGAIVGSLSGGVMMAMNFSFDTLFFIIAVPAAISAVMLTLLITVVRQSTSVPDSLPRAGVVNE